MDLCASGYSVKFTVVTRMRSAFPVLMDATVAQMVISIKTSATARRFADTEAFHGGTSTERDVWTCTPITYTLSTDASPNVSYYLFFSLLLLADRSHKP